MCERERGSSFRQQERRAVFHLQPTNRQIDRQTVGPGLGRPPICPLLIHLLSSGCHMEPHTKLMESPSSALLFYDFFLTSLASFPPFILPSCALPSFLGHTLSSLCSLIHSSFLTSPHSSIRNRITYLACITVFIPSSWSCRGGGSYGGRRKVEI